MTPLENAKQRLPLPLLMQRLGLGEHAKKSARCPFHEDQHNSFSVWQTSNNLWRWKCHAGCGRGDEIDFLARYKNISKNEAIKLLVELAGIAETSKGLPEHQTNNQHPSPIDWQRCV